MISFYKNEFLDDKLSVDVNSPAFKYGVGFFETIAYNGKVICHLDKHLKRIIHSLDTYQIKYQIWNQVQNQIYELCSRDILFQRRQ